MATAHVERRTWTTWPGSGNVGNYLPTGCRSARFSATVAVPMPVTRLTLSTGSDEVSGTAHSREEGSVPRSPVEPIRDTASVADWSPLRALLAEADTSVTLAWDELDRLVGGLPRPAYEHNAF